MKTLLLLSLILFTIDGPLWFTVIQLITALAIALAVFNQKEVTR